ncbi:MAG: UvrD-helicase domain-containing protein, partial [Lachnospiraceae bacterium]|nr:UvrD-helicase domain-containing protein [Lachnospiraceae bacterium]
TFTNAAAAEMRERIAVRLAECLQENPESEHIQRQSTLLHNAQITTIDSFSLFLIKNHFNEIGLDPAFRVADEGEIKLLSKEVLQELLEDSYASGNEAFTYCVEYFCPSGKESILEKHILELSAYAASFPWPEEWLLARKKDYAIDTVEALEQSDYGKYLTGYISQMLTGCVEKLMEVQGLCESPDGPYMYGELIDKEIEQVQGVLRYNTLSEYAKRMPAIVFGRLPAKKDASVSVDKRELAKALRSEVKDTLQGLSEQFFTTPLELSVEQGRACAAPVETLIDLVLEFNKRMHQKKQERRLIDFSDMEHYALDILLEREGEQIRPSHVALEYRQHFHEILIDEYQDSNLVQEYLLKAVSGEEDGKYNRFMVGDVKQSIYKFRLARPELFLEKYDTYQESGDCRRIDLARNFRSRVQVVDTVNHIFQRIMSKEIGGIAYDEKAALYAGAAYPENEGCDSEFLLIEKPEKDAELNARQVEALAIANKIKELRQNFQVMDKATGKLREVCYKDMVILLRSNSGWDEPFKKVLEEEGIPAYITSKTGYFAATEVQELLQLLRVLDNPYQDIPLYGVMKSLFGGFTEEEIAAIRASRKHCSLYEALLGLCQREEGIREEVLCEKAASQEPSREGNLEVEILWEEAALKDKALGEKLQWEVSGEALIEKVTHFLKCINHYRDCVIYMPIRELLQKLVEDYDYLNYVTALPGGSKRRANVEMLFTKASDFEKTSYFGLFHFIRYIEQLEKYDVDYGEADTLDENADVVRIMSIHKSKGLEFAVTFVSGLSKRFNMQDSNQSMIVDMDYGLATDYLNPEKRIRNKTLRRAVLSRKLRVDNLSEELRILYVALTRAKEKLIMTGTLEKAEEKWNLYSLNPKERLGFLDFAEAGNYLDFVLPVLSKTNVKMSIISGSELLREQVTEQLQLQYRKNLLQDSAYYVNLERLEELKQRFSYEYAYKRLEKLYTKTTVSELKIAAMAMKDEAAYHIFEEEEVVPYIPAFRREKEEVSGAVRGSAFHRVMELLNFEKLLGKQFEQFPPNYQTFQETIDKELLTRKLHAFLLEECAALRLTKEYLEAVNEKKLIHFLISETSYRMWAADRRGQLYREQPFVLGIDATKLGKEFPAEETVLIQGIIDVFFEEDGELILLDYKTDVIKSMDELWNRYEVQLDYYAEALTKLMALPVKERLLYSFCLEQVG